MLGPPFWKVTLAFARQSGRGGERNRPRDGHRAGTYTHGRSRGRGKGPGAGSGRSILSLAPGERAVNMARTPSPTRKRRNLCRKVIWGRGFAATASEHPSFAPLSSSLAQKKRRKPPGWVDKKKETPPAARESSRKGNGLRRRAGSLIGQRRGRTKILRPHRQKGKKMVSSRRCRKEVRPWNARKRKAIAGGKRRVWWSFLLDEEAFGSDSRMLRPWYREPRKRAYENAQEGTLKPGRPWPKRKKEKKNTHSRGGRGSPAADQGERH